MYTGASGNGRVVILPKTVNTYCVYAPVDSTAAGFTAANGGIAITGYGANYPFTSGSTSILKAIGTSESSYIWRNYSHTRLVGCSVRA